ncbi:MAG: hypothetical protein WBW33_28620 [Bryobacteraceae bacterium]
MWLKIMLFLFTWFVGAVALGILAGKSMALGSRIGRWPDDLQDDFDGEALAQTRELLKLQQSHPAECEPVFPELQPAKR